MKHLFRSVGLCFAATLCFVLFNNCAQPKNNNSQSNTANTTQPNCFSSFGTNTEWSGETLVEIDGYSANAMEPKTSADQVVLFWNDKPASDDAMNIHYAVKQSNGRYLYIGTLPGTVSTALDGVPSIDSAGNFYFTSLRTYTSNLQTIFSGQVNVIATNSLSIINVAPADSNVSLKQSGKVDMDVDVSWDGTMMLASRATFSGKSYPDSSYLELFSVSNRTASSVTNSSTLLKSVNLAECRVYAPTLSNDMKELYFTVFPANVDPTASDFRIVVAKRNSISDPFGTGAIIKGITGDLTEGPSITYNDSGKTLFYHKKDPSTGQYKIYKVTRP
jgi:hypothetical protein